MVLRGEIIAIGDELITGVQIDTNGPYLAERLLSRGISVQRVISVGDNAEAIAHALKEGMERAELVLVTGGLGPTSDDITTEVAARVLKRKLQLYPEVWEHIKKMIVSFGLEITNGQKKQAYLPEGADLIPNPIGTAPGYLVKEESSLLIFLPGVPREMQAMTENTILPRLEKEGKDRLHYQSRTLMVFGISESKADELLRSIPQKQNDIQIAFLPHFPEIRVRITVNTLSGQEADEKLMDWEKEIKKRLGPYVFGVDGESMEGVVGDLLRKEKFTIAVAESCTGGLIGHRLTNIPGSSDYVERVVVAYSNQAKVDLLKVPERIIQSHGAVSEPTARFMAEGVRDLAGTNLGLSTTGIAGPGGDSPEKPVGTVFISLTDGKETWTRAYHFPGDRHQIKVMTSQVALNQVRRYFLKK
ncbi:MAG: competence/damage-inducible protein A [Deltaproteobacteria bacterium]|nr:competence/damage-inducible protein A [Deltaproteobacteria bacterium]